MKKIYIYILLVLFGSQILSAQNIKIVRTDVDSLRKSFVTATFQFGFDIYLENIESCNGVAFQLNYSKADVIKYSDYQIGDFGKPYVIHTYDNNGNGKIIVGVTTGTNNISDSIKSPKVIHLEFVVLPTAKNSDTSLFVFDKPIATINKNGTGSTLELKAPEIKFAIHSFVNVWPGDTDNNGIVDHLDFGPVSQYVGMGSSTKNLRSFKRKSQSSIWAAHKCLVWDSAAVTYSDCDGNGDVTVSDMLIVTYNIGKDTSMSKISQSENHLLTDYPQAEKFNPSFLRIPIRFNSNRDFLAASGKIRIDNKKLKVIGIENSNLFNKNEFSYFFDESDDIEFVIGTFSKEKNNFKNGILCYLVCEQSDELLNEEYSIMELNAIDLNGSIYALTSPTSVQDSTLSPIFFQTSDNLWINNTSNINRVRFIDTYGNIQLFLEPYSQSIDINTLNLPNGMYLVEVSNGSKNFMKKLIIYR